jgi:hypothetical protein
MNAATQRVALDNDHRVNGHARLLPNCPRCREAVFAEHQAGEHHDAIYMDCGLCINEAADLGIVR